MTSPMNDDINALYPGTYWKAAELDKPKLMTIDRVLVEKVGEDVKPVLYFIGEERGMTLAKVNANTISELYGSKHHAWHGCQIVIYHDPNVFFGGKKTGGIRVRAPRIVNKPAPVLAQRRPDPISTGPADFVADDIADTF